MFNSFPSHVQDFLSLSQEEGAIQEIVQPNLRWRVHAYGSYWFACTNYPTALKPGDRVKVTGLRGIELLIEPIDPQPAAFLPLRTKR